MKRLFLSIIFCFISICAFADSNQYLTQVMSLYNQGKYEDALVGFKHYRARYPDEAFAKNCEFYIDKCNSKINAQAEAAKVEATRRARANEMALQRRREKKLIYISSNVINCDGNDLSSIIINEVQNNTNLQFTAHPDSAFYYVYFAVDSRILNYENGVYHSDVLANVLVKDIDNKIKLADQFEETEGSTLNYNKATEICYKAVGQDIAKSISIKIGGVVTSKQSNEKKVITVIAASNFMNIDDLDFVELQFRNAFQDAGYTVKKPEFGAISELRTKIIANQEAGRVSYSEVIHLTEKVGANLLCAIVINQNKSFGTYNLSSSTIDLANGTILGREAFFSMQDNGSIKNQNAVLEAANRLIRDMKLTNDPIIITNLTDKINDYKNAYDNDVKECASREQTSITKKNFLDEYKKTKSLKKASTSAGIYRSQLNDWRNTDSEFDRQYKTIEEGIIDNENIKKYNAKTDGKALGLSIIPGVGLMAKGHTGEGVAYLLGDLALIGGGVGMTIYSNHLNDVINNPNSSYDEYNKAVKGYDSARVTSYVCYGCAGALYIVNLIRAYVATPTDKAKLQYPLVPVLPVNGTNPGIGFSLAYKF